MSEVEIPRNCRTCSRLGSDTEGGDYSAITWPVCSINNPKANLKSFPFKKEQKCHIPDFWQYLEYDKEIENIFMSSEGGNFEIAYDLFVEKYIKTKEVK